MTNEYYDHTTYPSTGAAGSSSAMRTELDAIEAGFAKLPPLASNGLKIVGINAGGTAMTTVTTTGTGSVVLATSPTLVTPTIGVATATSINGLTITASTGTMTVANGKTLTASNTITLTANDGSTLAIGAGGTLGTAAYTAASAYSTLSFSTISVSGQSDVVADSTGDTLTLAAGTNITITTNSSTDTITITGTPSGVTSYTATSTGANVTLTSASSIYQKITPTAYDVAVILPDATTLTVKEAFVIENAGLYPMPVQANGGTLLGWCMPGATVICYLLVASPAAGTWKISTGERDRDAGLNWWGAPAVITSTTTPNILNVAISTQYGIIGYFNGTDYVIAGYSLAEDRTNFGTAVALISAANLAGITAIDGVALSTTEVFLAYIGSGAVDTKVVTVDINTSTLAPTINTPVSIDTTPTSGGALSCDKISSSLALVTFGSSTYLKCRTISVAAGVCTANSAAQIVGSNTVGASCKVLSSTLAHVYYYSSGAANLSICRVPLSGTTVTPGTPVAVTSRLNASSLACFDLAKASATASWSIALDSNNVMYGEVFTDTGSTITITESALLTGPATEGSAQIDRASNFMASDYSAAGLIVSRSSGGEHTGFRKASVSGTAVTISPLLNQSANFAAIPPSTTSVQIGATFIKNKPFNGVGLYGVIKASGSKIAYQPFAVK